MRKVSVIPPESMPKATKHDAVELLMKLREMQERDSMDMYSTTVGLMDAVGVPVTGTKFCDFVHRLADILECALVE